MPKGPRGEKRPADAIGRAVMVAKIAIGEIKEETRDASKEHHRRGGKIGGAARAKALTKAQREDIARVAAEARWKKD